MRIVFGLIIKAWNGCLASPTQQWAIIPVSTVGLATFRRGEDQSPTADWNSWCLDVSISHDNALVS